MVHETTYANTSAALFGVAQRTTTNWAILYKDEHRKTWTYLRKKMITHFGNMQSSRSFIDAMFGIRQRTDTFDNLDKFNADVVDTFQVVREMLPLPDAPPLGNYNAQQWHDREQQVHENVLNKICMAFMTQLLPPEIRAKVLEKNLTTMAESAEYAAEAQRLIRDKSQPIGTATAKPRVLAIQEDLDADDLDALVLNVVDRAFKETNFNPGNHNQGRLAASNGTKPKSQKQCTYCQKTEHGQDDCYARKNDKAPCFNSKGDPYFPKSYADWKGPPTGSARPAAPIVSRGQGFPHWV